MVGRGVLCYLLMLMVLLPGCTMVGPDFETPQVQIPEEWQVENNELFKKPSQDESVAWWKLFQDPVLDRLVATAFRQNLPLQTAALRIVEARATLGFVKGTLYPQVQQATGDLYTNGTSGPAENRYFTTGSVGFDAAWEMDFWGKYRRGIESADASFLATVASYEDLLVSLSAEVATTYFTCRTLQERVDIATQNGELQKRSLRLVTLQFEAGTVTELDVLQAKTLLSTTLASIPQLNAALTSTKYALALLLGMLPDQIDPLLGPHKALPILTTQIAIGIPAELLRRRPDVRYAEKLAAAQSGQIGVARSELFPSFTLFGALGWSSTDRGGDDLGDIFNSDNFSYTFGPAFTWNLFHYGRLKNQVRIQDAKLQQLIASYQNTVLNAAREVEDAMQILDQSIKQAELVKQGVASSKRSTELSMLQYKEGLADYQRVLDSTRSLIQRQDQYAQVKGSIITNVVALYKAVGGGWEVQREQGLLPPNVVEEMEQRTDWGQLLQETIN